MEVIAGIDIGGTKCAVSFIHMNGDEVEFLSKEKRPTDESHPDEMVQSFVNEIASPGSCQRDCKSRTKRKVHQTC